MYEKFETLIKEKGITPHVVSQGTGIPPSTFSDWKSGRSKPKLPKLVKIADYLEVPITYFIDE